MAKSFSWSFSRLKNYETCPRKYYAVDVMKKYSEPITPGSPLDFGNKLHAAFAAALLTGNKLPEEFSHYQNLIDTERNRPGKMLVEQKYAITQKLTRTDYFAPNAWFRGIADVVHLLPPIASVRDWKTGKPKYDSVQLMLLAQCIMAHFPDIEQVKTEFIWLQEDDAATSEVYGREDVAGGWVSLLPRVAQLEQATIKNDFPPKPSGLCKRWCPDVSCPFHGKGAY